MAIYQVLDEAIGDAESDMAEVRVHAAAIVAAIRKTQPWLNNETYAGTAADQWFSGWAHTYRQVLTLLDSVLPTAEKEIVAQVTKQVRAEVTRLEKQQAHGSSAG